MKIRTAALLASLALVVTGCSPSDGGTAPTTEGQATGQATTAEGLDTSSDEALPGEVAAMLEGYGVSAQDGVRAAIVTLDHVEQERPLSVQASVRTDEVVFSDGEQEVVVPVPGDLVYVSVAPYQTYTHPCHFHALGGCQGEMVGEDVQVTIVDDSGATLVEEETTTYTNGFVGYWLPKDTNGTITITQGELSGEVPFETGDGDATCVATLQLGA